MLQAHDQLEPLEGDALLQFHMRRDQWAERLAEQLDIPNWVAINRLITLPIEAWIGNDEWSRRFGLHPLIKRAIAMEVDKIASRMNSERSEQDRKLEMEKAELKQKLNIGPPNSSFHRVFQQ